MRKIISIISIGLMLSSCNEKIVPREIQLQFLELEPSAHKITWTIDEDIYQVDYISNSKKATSYFDLKGNWLETESEIDKSELPEGISNTLKNKLNEYSIIDIELIKTQDNQILYEVDLIKESKIYDILFDKSGKILRKKI